MVETAFVALQSARTYLNDINGVTWTDSVLMPILQEAHRELVQELDLNGVGVLKQQTSPILVPAGSLDLGNNQPYNILEPISMLERDPGEDPEFFINMVQVNFLPEVDPSQDLGYWSFNQQVIAFVGATQDKEVILRFKGWIPTPGLTTDQIGVISGARFLGARIAAIACDTVGRESKRLHELASMNLYKIMQRATKGTQWPVRRRGYRSSKVGISVGPTGTFGSY